MMNTFYLVCWFTILSNQLILSKADPLQGPSGKILIVSETEFDFIVSISFKDNVNQLSKTRVEDRHECGGSLITKKHVLTSAHCKCKDHKLTNYVVKVGLLLTEPKGQYDISSWHTFKKGWCFLFRRGYKENDISVIKLSEEVRQEIDLPILNYSPIDQLYNKNAITAGWGNVVSVRNPIVMQKIKVKTISKKECQENIYNALKLVNDRRSKETHQVKLENNTLCSNSNGTFGNPDDFVILGQGDSGSPLVIAGTNEIIGINEATSTMPSQGPNYVEYEQNLHTALFPYREFIENELSKKECSKKSSEKRNEIDYSKKKVFTYL